MTRPLLPEFVLRHHTFGHAVIPTNTRKKGLVRWKAYQDARADLDQVNEWHLLWPDAMWATITGRVSGVFTLDFDGDEGCERLHEFGLNPHRRTPSGGYHVDIELPDFLVRTTTWKADATLGGEFAGLDIRGEGGIAVISGSTARGNYEALRPIFPDPFASVPETLIPHLRKRLARQPGPPRIRRTQGVAAPLAADQGDMAASLVAMALKKVSDGEGRNSTGFWLACQCRDHGLAVAETEALVLAYQGAIAAAEGSTR